MSDKRTRIAVVLDRSGSMDSVRDEAIQAFNENVEKLTRDAGKGGETTLSLFAFNHNIDTIFENEQLDKIRKIDKEAYVPSGTTALNDTIAFATKSIQEVENFQGDVGALVIVISDGYENASRTYSKPQIAQLIRELEATGKWTFTFMMANVDIRGFQRDYGAQVGNISSFVATRGGTQAMGVAVASSSEGYMDTRALGETQTGSFYSGSDPKKLDSTSETDEKDPLKKSLTS